MTATAIQSSIVTTISLDDTVIDPLVQREEGVDQRRIDRMAPNFNPNALGLFIVSQRADGTLVVLDGAHRRALAQQVGYRTHVDARVFTGLSLAEEAALFLLYNDKKDPSAISRFKARVLTGESVAFNINEIVREYGWRIGAEKANAGVIAAVVAVERVYRTGSRTVADGEHPEVLERALGAITSAWGHDPTAGHQAIIEGVGQLYGRFGEHIDTAKLVRELQGTTPRPLIGRAKALRDLQGGTVPSALAKSLVGMHNNRRRSNLLPEWIWTR